MRGNMGNIGMFRNTGLGILGGEKTKMKSKIYIITRFNAPCFPTRTDLAERRLDDTWLRERVRLFKKYCYPSVMNQSCKDFEWIIWCHPDSPDWMRVELSKLLWLDPLYDDSYYKYIDTDVDTLVTIRLDNDDMIHHDFVKTIHDYIEVFQESGLPRQVHSFPKGYKYDDTNKALREVEMHNNPFLAMFANLREKFNLDTDHLVYYADHGRMTDIFPTVYNNDLRAWAWVKHGGNTAGIACKPGATVDKTILKEFGVGQ